MKRNRLEYIGAELIPAIGLGEDALAQRSSVVAAFFRIPNLEDQLHHLRISDWWGANRTNGAGDKTSQLTAEARIRKVRHTGAIAKSGWPETGLKHNGRCFSLVTIRFISRDHFPPEQKVR